MKKKTELDDIDVIFDPKPLTEDEKSRISEFIRRDKAKRGGKNPVQHRPSKRRAAKV